MFSQNVHFWGPNWIGGAWYGIFLIRQKPTLPAGDLRNEHVRSESFDSQSLQIKGFFKNAAPWPTMEPPNERLFYIEQQKVFDLEEK